MPAIKEAALKMCDCECKDVGVSVYFIFSPSDSIGVNIAEWMKSPDYSKKQTIEIWGKPRVGEGVSPRILELPLDVKACIGALGVSPEWR